MSDTRTNQTALILSENIIYTKPDTLLNCPRVSKSNNDQLILTFSETVETSNGRRTRSLMLISYDNGITWSDPMPIPELISGITITKSGTMIATLQHLSATIRSTDSGLNWENQVQCMIHSVHSPLELSDGTLIILGNKNQNNQKEINTSPIISVQSKDQGLSWITMPQVMPVPTGESRLSNPHVMELDTGTLVALATYEPSVESDEDRYMRQVESENYGETWSLTHPSNMWGSSPHLLGLNNGDGLSTYNHMRPPYSIRACIRQKVRDKNMLGGNSSGNWDISNVNTIVENSSPVNYGHPTTIEVLPGELITVYLNKDNPDGNPYIASTRWTL